MTVVKTQRTCTKGHSYFKSSSCPICPLCEAETTTNDFTAKLALPARWALINGGIVSLAILASYSEKEILKLHGFGKSSLPHLRAALATEGLAFKH
jgi:DNA-directed RNA polymerase alpha subunit